MKRNFFFPTLVTLVSVLAISSIGATYAWYQYQTYVSVDFGGTSIDATKVFQVGLVSDVELDCANHNITYEYVDGKNVYWVNGAATSDLTEYYLAENGYGTKYLHGVTSGKYSTGEDFSLKCAPEFNANYWHISPEYYDYANQKDYLHFGLAFKVNQISSTGAVSIVENNGIRLSGISFMDYENELFKSLRVHFSNDEPGSDFIFNPSSANDGYDTVGGILDLFDDGIYDCTNNRKGLVETPYGEYETLVYKEQVTTDGVDRTLNDGDGNCFTGHHQNGAYAIDLEQTVWSQSEYLGTKTVLTNNKTLAKSGDSGIAYFNMDIYLEGWDTAFTNDVMDKAFGCNVEFESI